MRPESGALSRLEGLKPVAVIDIGSNSVRLVAYEGATRSPNPIFNEKALCGLGRSLASNNRLSKDSMERALRALQRFRAVADLIGASTLHVIATAAAREAKNGADFIRDAESICGTKIDVLTGKREAQLAAAAVVSGMNEADGMAADLGGGSLEIIDIKKMKLVGGITLPLGSLRLLDISDGDYRQAAVYIDEQLKNVDWFESGAGRPLYAIGGTWRAFARLHMAQTRYPLPVMHGYKMSVEEALKFSHLLDHLSPTSLDGIEDISKARRETVPFGALVLERMIRLGRPSELIFSILGIREGLLYNLLSNKEKARDPLIAACEDLALLRARSPENAWELCHWTDALFKKPGPRESPAQKRLRRAVCLLSDIGWRAHPDYRAEKCLNQIAHAAFTGVDHADRAFLALTIFYRHHGLAKAQSVPRLQELIDDDAVKRAQILGASIRTAHMLCASMSGVIGQTPIYYEDKALVLEVPVQFRALVGERLERRFAVLAGLLEREPEIRLNKKTKRQTGKAGHLAAKAGV